jgi:two-component system sensor histidine kinase YesM
MNDRIKSVEGRVIFLMVMFALGITVLVLVFSYHMISAFQRRAAIQSAEFNLQLVSSLIEQDLIELSALARWCGYNATIGNYFLASEHSVPLSLDAWGRLQEEYVNNRAGRYVRRIIVFDAKQERLLQTGNLAATTEPVMVYNLNKIFDTGLLRNSRWQAILRDPYYPAGSPVIPFLCPVYSPMDGSEIGTVFLAAAAGLITNKLSAYTLPEDSRLYLKLEETYYVFEDDGIQNADEIPDGRDALVSYPVREGITLIQALPNARIMSFRGSWPATTAGLLVLIVLLILLGWGVRRQTREITGLMEKRIADEKHKRDLEYRMLQSQINPHFLYNTLNSIKWMAAIQNAPGIAEMTTALSRLLQRVSRDSRRMASLREELALLDDYLVIQKYRYGDSVTLEKKIAHESLLDTPVPRFVLQPLAENAIFHGIEPKGSGVITVEVTQCSDDVLVSLTDDGVGMDAAVIERIRNEPRDAVGMFRELGVRNVDERLRHAFGEDYGLVIESETGKYTSMTLRLPLNRRQEAGNG